MILLFLQQISSSLRTEDDYALKPKKKDYVRNPIFHVFIKRLIMFRQIFIFVFGFCASFIMSLVQARVWKTQSMVKNFCRVNILLLFFNIATGFAQLVLIMYSDWIWIAFLILPIQWYFRNSFLDMKTEQH